MIKTQIETNNPHDLDLGVILIEPFICLIGGLLMWLVLNYFGLNSTFLNGSLNYHSFSMSYASLFLFIWVFSLYNIIHNLFCIHYMFRHDIIETKQPWKYLIRIKWYNEW